MYYYAYDVCAHAHSYLSTFTRTREAWLELSSLHSKYLIYRAIVLLLQRELLKGGKDGVGCILHIVTISRVEDTSGVEDTAISRV